MAVPLWWAPHGQYGFLTMPNLSSPLASTTSRLVRWPCRVFLAAVKRATRLWQPSSCPMLFSVSHAFRSWPAAWAFPQHFLPTPRGSSLGPLPSAIHASLPLQPWSSRPNSPHRLPLTVTGHTLPPLPERCSHRESQFLSSVQRVSVTLVHSSVLDWRHWQ